MELNILIKSLLLSKGPSYFHSVKSYKTIKTGQIEAVAVSLFVPEPYSRREIKILSISQRFFIVVYFNFSEF